MQKLNFWLFVLVAACMFASGVMVIIWGGLSLGGCAIAGGLGWTNAAITQAQLIDATRKLQPS
jgi:hypothetical protein